MIDITFNGYNLSSSCFKNNSCLNIFKKYICACDCIYELFGVHKTQYITVENNPHNNNNNFDDLYSSNGYGTQCVHIPEVVHHTINTQCITDKEHIDTVINIYNTKESINQFTYNHVLNKPSISLPPTALSPITTSSNIDSQDSDSQDSDSNSIDFIVPEQDLPEREVWDIL